MSGKMTEHEFAVMHATFTQIISEFEKEIDRRDELEQALNKDFKELVNAVEEYHLVTEKFLKIHKLSKEFKVYQDQWAVT